MFIAKLSHTLQVTKHRIHKVHECMFFQCMDLISAVTQKCISTCPRPWHSHLLLWAPLKTSQMREKWGEACYPDLCCNLCTTPELTLKCVCVSQCHLGLLFSGDDARYPQWHVFQFVPHSLCSGDMEQVLSPGVCLSPTEPSPQILSKEPQWSVTTGLPKPAKKRQGLGCPVHSSWWNVIWWYRELNTVILNLRTTRDCFLFLTSRF